MQKFPPGVQAFDVQHDYIESRDDVQARIRKRGQGGNYIYSIMCVMCVCTYGHTQHMKYNTRT